MTFPYDVHVLNLYISIIRHEFHYPYAEWRWRGLKAYYSTSRLCCLISIVWFFVVWIGVTCEKWRSHTHIYFDSNFWSPQRAGIFSPSLSLTHRTYLQQPGVFQVPVSKAVRGQGLEGKPTTSSPSSRPPFPALFYVSLLFNGALSLLFFLSLNDACPPSPYDTL